MFNFKIIWKKTVAELYFFSVRTLKEYAAHRYSLVSDLFDGNANVYLMFVFRFAYYICAFIKRC